MRCIICGKTSEEIDLYDGIYENELTKLCEKCAELENIPLIKKPTEDQLKQAEHRYSVRERLEKLSGIRKEQRLSKDQIMAHKNLAKLRFPKERQQHVDLIDNYFWIIQQARRKKKLSWGQIAQQTGIDEELLAKTEKGILPENPKPIFESLELVLGIRLLKRSSLEVRFKTLKEKESEERKILEETRQRMENSEKYNEKKQGTITKLQKGELDFSKKGELENITIHDLVKAKKEKEKKEMKLQMQKNYNNLFGDDLEIEEF